MEESGNHLLTAKDVEVLSFSPQACLHLGISVSWTDHGSVWGLKKYKKVTLVTVWLSTELPIHSWHIWSLHDIYTHIYIYYVMYYVSNRLVPKRCYHQCPTVGFFKLNIHLRDRNHIAFHYLFSIAILSSDMHVRSSWFQYTKAQKVPISLVSFRVFLFKHCYWMILES